MAATHSTARLLTQETMARGLRPFTWATHEGRRAMMEALSASGIIWGPSSCLLAENNVLPGSINVGTVTVTH